jgi:hypothetical protein
VLAVCARSFIYPTFILVRWSEKFWLRSSSTILAAHPNLIALSVRPDAASASAAVFIEARAFLDALPFPKLVVPGNHDVPLYNFYARFADGLKRYRKYISADTEPYYQDDEIAVSRNQYGTFLTFKGGRISERQVALARERLAPLTGLVKIIVTHHPFDLPEHYSSGLWWAARAWLSRHLPDSVSTCFSPGIITSALLNPVLGASRSTATRHF